RPDPATELQPTKKTADCAAPDAGRSQPPGPPELENEGANVLDSHGRQPDRPIGEHRLQEFASVPSAIESRGWCRADDFPKVRIVLTHHSLDRCGKPSRRRRNKPAVAEMA